MTIGHAVLLNPGPACRNACCHAVPSTAVLFLRQPVLPPRPLTPTTHDRRVTRTYIALSLSSLHALHTPSASTTLSCQDSTSQCHPAMCAHSHSHDAVTASTQAPHTSPSTAESTQLLTHCQTYSHVDTHPSMLLLFSLCAVSEHKHTLLLRTHISLHKHHSLHPGHSATQKHTQRSKYTKQGYTH